MIIRPVLKQILKGAVLAAAVLYFLIDALFLSLINSIFKRLADLPVVAKEKRACVAWGGRQRQCRKTARLGVLLGIARDPLAHPHYPRNGRHG